LKEQQAKTLIEKIRAACRECGAYCQVIMNEKPELEHVKIEVNAKVET
jgi:Fe-S-cluster containining protein